MGLTDKRHGMTAIKIPVGFSVGIPHERAFGRLDRDRQLSRADRI